MANTSDKTTESCDLLHGLVKDYCEHKKGGSAGKDPCSGLPGPAKDLCESGHGGGGGSTGITGGASGHVEDLAMSLIKTLSNLVAPGHTWAPEKASSGVYAPFLWLGQHLAVAIFLSVVVVCAMTAWQGEPRLRQMGASTGAALAAVAGMAAVPGVVLLLNKAINSAFTTAFNSNETTLFGAIQRDMENGADANNPLATLIIISALVVALAFATLVFLTRNLGILAFVCIAPLVLASLARSGDTSAVRAWGQRLLGVMFCPFALLLVSPFVQFAKGSLVVDSVLLVAADALMLRMIFHGIPYIGPRVAGAARELVERHTTNRLGHMVVRAGVPTVYEQENSPRGYRTVQTPGRAVHQDRGVLFAAYGIRQRERSPRLTTASAITQATREAGRSAQISQARRDARAAAGFPAPAPRAPRPAPEEPNNP
ncbi:energy-coupling factor transporter transmembrane protein EcfT [Streptomyces sp. 8L]|uniref:energy-coupling factor transporter transmembrane protein EcfT n=1 Tax=Streptomyces sp. 8L TaxID=2877242 RepID=UPI001CD64B78|nr:energy-coupling factor transporter transmembrane protein EcfT [Streptomyces sp. 8L]MCA1219274.1 energy-coupling factor transporter transmembrane protein EcfT [Streptomyces sp. 8L]